MSFAAQGDGHQTHSLLARQADIFVCDTSNAPPQLVWSVPQQDRSCAEGEVFASPSDRLLHGRHGHPRRGVRGSGGWVASLAERPRVEDRAE